MEKTKTEIAIKNVKNGLYWTKSDACRKCIQASKDFDKAKADIADLCANEKNPAMFLALLNSYTENARRAYSDIVKYSEMGKMLDEIASYAETEYVIGEE